MIKLIAIVGTNSKRSTNRQLLQYMQKHFADKAEIELVEIKDIPVFNKPADKQVPEAVLDIVAKIEEADGVIIGTPEYDQKSKRMSCQMNSCSLIHCKPLIKMETWWI